MEENGQVNKAIIDDSGSPTFQEPTSDRDRVAFTDRSTMIVGDRKPEPETEQSIWHKPIVTDIYIEEPGMLLLAMFSLRKWLQNS